jgi:hypothetical protein
MLDSNGNFNIYIKIKIEPSLLFAKECIKHPSLWEGLVRLFLDMKIQANASGTRSIEITKEHLETLHKYSLLNGLIDSNGIVDEPVLDKLKLNIRSLLDSVGTSDKALLDLCFDVIYHKDMKALGLHNLILLYADTKFETPAVEEVEE